MLQHYISVMEGSGGLGQFKEGVSAKLGSDRSKIICDGVY